MPDQERDRPLFRFAVALRNSGRALARYREMKKGNKLMLDNLAAAREQMALLLGFHIIFAVLGVGLPWLLLFVEDRAIRTGDQTWMRLARTWSKAAAVLFAVGAVSGTVLSFEFGLLWPRFTQRFGSAFGPFHDPAG